MHAGKWKIFLVLTNIIGNRGWHKTCLTMLKHHLEHLWSFIIKWFQPFVGSWIVLKLYYSRAVHVTIFLSLSILFFYSYKENKAFFLTCSKIIQFRVVDCLARTSGTDHHLLCSTKKQNILAAYVGVNYCWDRMQAS